MTSNEEEKKKQGNSKSTSSKISEQISNAELRSLCEFWDEVRGDKLLPCASDIDPAQIAHILKDVAIFDVIDEGTIRYRLAGTSIAERMGTDPTGQNLIEMTADKNRGFVSKLIWTIVTQPVAALVTYENTYHTGKNATVESLCLPLEKAAGQSDRIISVHTPKETLSYGDKRAASVVATKISSIVWIDIGAGIPEEFPTS